MSYADVNGLHLYYEDHGAGDHPLILLHGGFGATEALASVVTKLSASRRVVPVDLQAHGRTADIDRPMRYEAMADDIAGLIGHLGVETADVMGYSLGGGAAARTAIQHPDLVRRLVLVSVPCRRSAWFPEVRAGMAQVASEEPDLMMQSPIYEMYARIAPRVEDWPRLVDKVGELVNLDYDWTEEVSALRMPVLLAAADSDSFSPAHAAEFYALLGGGLRDAGWDGSGKQPNRLVIVPDATHYDMIYQPVLAQVTTAFLDEKAL